MKHYRYNELPEIREVLISAQQWRNGVAINEHIYFNLCIGKAGEQQREHMIECAKREILNGLADQIGKFVKIEVNMERMYVQGEIHMPYVRNHELELRDLKIKDITRERDQMRESWDRYINKSRIAKIWMAITRNR